MQAAHGAAVMADGLAGGVAAELVEHLGIRDASGTVLDYLSRHLARAGEEDTGDELMHFES